MHLSASQSGTIPDDIDFVYKIVAFLVFVLTAIASVIISHGRFDKPKNERFLYFHYEKIWRKMINLSVLKGLAQGYIATAPAMLTMSLVGNESTLGIV